MKKSEIQLFNREKNLAIFDEKIEIRERCVVGHGACSCPGWGSLVFPLGLAGARLSSPQASAMFTGILADLLPSLSLSQHFGEMSLSLSFFVSNVAFAGFCHISLPFLGSTFRAVFLPSPSR